MNPAGDMYRVRSRTIEFIVWTAAALAVLGSRATQAQPTGSEFQVNTFTTGAQDYPSVAMDGLGNFVVAWQSAGQDGNGQGVFAQRYSSTGTALIGEFPVNTYTTSDQTRPSIAMDGSGSAVVVWQSLGQDGDGSGIFGQRFDSANNPIGTEFQVNTFTTGKQGLPRVAMNASGDFVVVWISFGQDGDGDGIFGQRYDSLGSKVGVEFQINTYFISAQFEPVVAMDNTGKFVVVWVSSGQDGSSFGVYGQRYNSTGNKAGSEFLINTFTTNTQRLPSVAMDASGNFVVVWQSLNQDGSSYGIYGQRYDGTGGTLGSEFLVNTYVTNQQQCAQIAVDGSGCVVAVWESNGQDGSNYGIYGQEYDSLGAVVGAEFRANTYVTNSQTHPAVAFDNSGNAVVVWASSGQDGSNFGVFGQRFGVGTVTAIAVGERSRLALSQNYPNPFNPTTTIEFLLPAAVYIRLSIHDVHGRELIVVEEGMRWKDRHLVSWDGRDASGQPVASGVYFYRLVAPGYVESKKMVLLR